MHGRSLATAVAASVAALALSAGAGAQPQPPAGHATLLPRGLAPLTLEGSGFARRERVRVTVTPTGRPGRTMRLRARRSGSFSVVFRGVTPCNGIEAVAVGRRGSRASFQLASVGCPSP